MNLGSTELSLVKRTMIVLTVSILVFLSTYLIYLGREVVVLSLLGVGLGVLVSPLLSMIRERFRIPRALAALVLLILAATSGALVFMAIWFLVADQVEMLSVKAPELLTNLQANLVSLYAEYPRIQQYLTDFDLAGTLKSGGMKLVAGVQSGFSAVSGLAFIVVIGLYTAVGAKDYHQSFVALMPPALRPRTTEIITCTSNTLRSWMIAQLIDMAAIGAITSVGLWIVGSNYWAVFGLLTALFGLIPYIGIFIVVVVASLITLASDPQLVLWVVGVFLITQQIEGNFIMPYVMKEKLQIPEVPLLIFMLFMASWLGLLGVFLSTPLFAVMRNVYFTFFDLSKPRENSSIVASPPAKIN